MKLTERRLKRIILDEFSALSEDEKWAKNIDVDRGEMHKTLDVPEDKKVSTYYTSGEQLARDLIDAKGRE